MMRQRAAMFTRVFRRHNRVGSLRGTISLAAGVAMAAITGVAGCQTRTGGGCPAAMLASVYLPPDVSSPVRSIVVSKPCEYFVLTIPGDDGSAGDDSVVIMNDGSASWVSVLPGFDYVVITRQDYNYTAVTTTCTIEVTLMDGERYAGVVEYHPMGGGGGCSTLTTTDTPSIILSPERLDAGMP